MCISLICISYQYLLSTYVFNVVVVCFVFIYVCKAYKRLHACKLKYICIVCKMALSKMRFGSPRSIKHLIIASNLSHLESLGKCEWLRLKKQNLYYRFLLIPLVITKLVPSQLSLFYSSLILGPASLREAARRCLSPSSRCSSKHGSITASPGRYHSCQRHIHGFRSSL